MDRFLIRAAFVSEALVRDRRGAYYLRLTLIRGNAVRLRMLSIVSENQNKLRKWCICSFVLKTDIIAIVKV